MQDLDYSESLNAYRTSIRTPFWKSAFLLGWPDNSIGFGINTGIIEKCLLKHSDLIIFSEYHNRSFRISYTDLKETLLTWHCDWYSGTALKVLPMGKFAEFKEESNFCVCPCGCQSVVQADTFLCPRCVTHA